MIHHRFIYGIGLTPKETKLWSTPTCPLCDIREMRTYLHMMLPRVFLSQEVSAAGGFSGTRLVHLLFPS